MIILSLLSLSAVLLLVCVLRLFRSLSRFSAPSMETPKEYPSVSVCIPARNENHAMTECLERVLASDYERMEIIVFDDNSADNTSILIKSFASAGVRFVPGVSLPEGWLGKNRALEILAREASGSLVIFMDVDTWIAPTTISRLVASQTANGADMLSVIPNRGDVGRASVLFGHLRYFWELLLDRSSAPAVSSSLWVIRRSVLLEELGGFEPIKDVVAPEQALATKLQRAYRCILSDKAFGVAYEKKWRSQVETAKRLLYPRLGGNWVGALLGVVAGVLMNVPTVALALGVLQGRSEVTVLALGILIGYMLVYGTFTSRIWWRRGWIGAFVWPVVILQELILLCGSILGYVRGTITWKGRSVTRS